MRYSKQRELILNTVLQSHVHPTADYVYNCLKTDYIELSLGTVYRNLNFLAEHNMLKKICVPNGSDRFDGTLTEHYHLICTKCGCVSDIDLPEISLIKDKISLKTGFTVTNTNFAFEGLCKACSEKNMNDD